MPTPTKSKKIAKSSSVTKTMPKKVSPQKSTQKSISIKSAPKKDAMNNKISKKNKKYSNESNNKKLKLKESLDEMDIDNGNLSDDSINFEMIDINEDDLEEELFNLKEDSSEYVELDIEDDSDIDDHIGDNDEYVSLGDDINIGYEELSDDDDDEDENKDKNRDKDGNRDEDKDSDEEDDDEKEEKKSKRQRIQEIDYNVIKLAFQRKPTVTKKLDPAYHLGLKELWNQVRIKNISKEKRNKYMGELFELMKGKIPEILFKNDTSRIIQTVLKYGTKEQKKIIVDELEGKWLEASKHTHSKFVICKVLMYCSEHRNKIISEFKGNIAKLIQHTEARSVILEAYELLNARQRSALIQEFYGKEFSLFKETQGLSIEELIKENPSNKERLLENLSREIEAIMKKPDLIGYIIPHHIILDYFNYANENKIREKVALIGEHIHEFLHTREGSRIAMMCFSYGTAKDRKIMLKAMKDYIEKICIEEYGHLVLLRAFDVVDDTVAVSKYIIEQMTKLNKLGNIIQNKWGHRVILYLLAHRTKLYFSNETLRLLAQGDDIRTKTSKKDPAVRVNELCKAISPALIDYAQNNTSTMFSFTYSTQVLCEILLHADGTLDQKKPILENIAKLANKDPNNEEAKDDHIMLSYINRTLKTLVHGRYWKQPRPQKNLQKDEDISSKKDESPQINYDEKVELHFAPILFDSIKEYVLFYACHLSASFVILALLEDKETNKDVKEALLKGLKQIRRAAEKDKKSGANLILKELEKEGIKLESNENKKESKQVIEESKGTIRDENNSGKKNNDKSNTVFEKVTKGKDKEIKKEKGINNGNKNNNRGTKRKR
ncbi:uncharacterized protein OCT59_013537 [Rhizophagus irregularis]|uniref:uncharacterized protein n=1 Tax=Rhizophagus irregularis TaxID=588596 RepID=UPI000CB8C297|nr:hypothetical protein OCT59_013537 [Rhizophagus irregularis]GBC45647.1 pumilio homolog 3-like [Rhizophagus irregularis DAOM 181602=DAOM 197198]